MTVAVAGVLVDCIEVTYLLDGQACIYLVCGAIGLAVVARSDTVRPASMVAATSGTPGR